MRMVGSLASGISYVHFCQVFLTSHFIKESTSLNSPTFSFFNQQHIPEVSHDSKLKIEGWNVNRKWKIKILLAITISLLLPVVTVYTDYYVLTEADFLSQNLKFENTDLDCLQLFDKRRFTAPTIFSYQFSAATNLTGQFSCLCYELTSPQLETLALRC